MDGLDLQRYASVVWTIGVVLFAAVIAVVIAAVVRAARRPPELHSAAERLQREVPQQPEVETKLRELAELQQSGRISEVEYEQRRAEVLAAAPGKH